MPNALLCAEAVALMVLGKELPEYFPQAYLVTSNRLKRAHEETERLVGKEAVKRIKKL